MRRTRNGKNYKSEKFSPACRHIQERMALFMDGELSPQEMRNVASHLNDCPACRREREQWQQAENALMGVRQHVPASGDLRSGFYARLADAPLSRRSGLRIDWRMAVPALAACGLAFGWLTTQRPVLSTTSGSVAVVPNTNTIATAPSVNSSLQIAQSGNSGTGNTHSQAIAANKPITSPSALFGLTVAKPGKRTNFKAAAVADNARRRIRVQGLRSTYPQLARLTLRRNRSEGTPTLEFRAHANSTSAVFAYEPTSTVNAPFGRITAANAIRHPARKQDEALYNEAPTAYGWAMAQPRSKNAPQINNDASAQTLAKTTDREKDTNRLGYTLSAAKAKKFGDLQNSLASVPMMDSTADQPRMETFALGLNSELREYPSDGARGLTLKASLGKQEGIYLKVQDSKRGFISETRIASRIQEQNGQRVLVIKADEPEPQLSENTQSAAESEQK